MRYTSMFKTLFRDFYGKKKLSLALKHIDYKPFKWALEAHDYCFFNQLLDVMPAEYYKKLALLRNNYELIKLFIRTTIEDENLNEKAKLDCLNASSAISQIISNYPDVASSYLNEMHNEENILEENNDNKLFISSHLKELASQTDKIDQNIAKFSVKRKLPIEFDSEHSISKKVKFSDENVQNELREDQLTLDPNSSDLVGVNTEALDHL